ATPLVLLLLACSGPATSQEPPSSPAAAPTGTAADLQAEPTAGMTPSAAGSDDSAGAARCGGGGAPRAAGVRCLNVLMKGDVECCYDQTEDACREAGCAPDDCVLLKSNPPQVRCR